MILDGGLFGITPAIGRLILLLPDGQRRFAAVVLLESIDLAAPQGQIAYSYKAQSDFAEHILSRYLFEKVVVPHRSQFLMARLRRWLGRLMDRRPEKEQAVFTLPSELQT